MALLIAKFQFLVSQKPLLYPGSRNTVLVGIGSGVELLLLGALECLWHPLLLVRSIISFLQFSMAAFKITAFVILNLQFHCVWVWISWLQFIEL
jgi:hypothetical protein